MTEQASNLSKVDLARSTPAEVREAFRSGRYHGDSWGLAPGFVHTAMVAVPQSDAYDFLLFAQRNPRPCPVLEVTEPGDPVLRQLAQGADVRSDLPGYRVFRRGECVAEPEDVSDVWSDDMVAFMIGCTASFEQHIVDAGIRLRHLELGQLVPIYITDRPCTPAGAMHGPLVVSMRPIRQDQVSRVVGLTARFPLMHGAPIHLGDASALGIADLAKPDFSDPIEVEEDEIPVFWACSVTPQVVAATAKIERMITNAPNHMFVADLVTEELATLP